MILDVAIGVFLGLLAFCLIPAALCLVFRGADKAKELATKKQLPQPNGQI